MREKVRKITERLFFAIIIICPLLYIGSVLFTESYYRDEFCANIITKAESKFEDDTVPYSWEWEEGQTLVISTDSEEYPAVFSSEQYWDRAFPGAALIEVTWRDGWYYVINLTMDGCNGS